MMDLFQHAEHNFDGSDIVPALDGARLKGQIRRVYHAMNDGRWHTLDWLANAATAPHASVSAQLRNLRKPKFGNFKIERKRSDLVHSGLWLYRMVK